MDKLEQYRTYIKQLITDYANLGSPDPDVETQLIFAPRTRPLSIGVCGLEKSKPTIWLCVAF